jgi:hypothetical protein
LLAADGVMDDAVRRARVFVFPSVVIAMSTIPIEQETVMPTKDHPSTSDATPEPGSREDFLTDPRIQAGIIEAAAACVRHNQERIQEARKAREDK